MKTMEYPVVKRQEEQGQLAESDKQQIEDPIIKKIKEQRIVQVYHINFIVPHKFNGAIAEKNILLS